MAACETRCIDLVVIGAGLGGLTAAWRTLQRRPGTSAIVLEAADDVGGRLRNGQLKIDVGGIWIWPGDNALASALISELGLQLAPQPHGAGFMDPSVVDGGTHRLAVRLTEEVERSGGKVLTSTKVSSVTCQDNLIAVAATAPAGPLLLRASSVIIAAPPRVALKSIEFKPPLSTPKQRAMTRTPAWMSKVTKLVLVYGHKWWLPKGVAAFPPDGPGFQFYDASTPDSNAVVTITMQAQMPDAELTQRVLAQLQTHYGEEAAHPQEIELKRWCHDPLINDDPEDERMFTLDPNPELARPEMGGRLFLGCSEAAPRHPGYIEGALEAAEIASRLALEVLAWPA